MRRKVLLLCAVVLGCMAGCANTGAKTSLRAKMFSLAEAIDSRDVEAIASLLPPGCKNAENVDVFMRRYFNLTLDKVESFKIDRSKYVSNTDPLTGLAWTQVHATLKTVGREKPDSGTITIQWQFSDGDLYVKLQ